MMNVLLSSIDYWRNISCCSLHFLNPLLNLSVSFHFMMMLVLFRCFLCEELSDGKFGLFLSDFIKKIMHFFEFDC
jgi:hypothetical protein